MGILSVVRCATVIRRIAEYEGVVVSSAVAFRESIKGALATVAEAESPNPRYKSVTVSDAYGLLIGIVTKATRFLILPYTNTAKALYRQILKNIVWGGPLDCRIAASAVASGMAVVISNTRHFTQIAKALPELRFVDWRAL